MSENVDNLVLEQLRLIREDIRKVEEQFSHRIDGLETKVDDLTLRSQSIEGVLFGLGGYIRSIDQRVEHIEDKLGVKG